MATEKSKPTAKSKKKELIVLDEHILMLATELFKHISVLNLDIDQHNNRKSIIISEKELNDYLYTSAKLAQIKDLKTVHLNILDNDILEIELALEKFDSKANLKKEIKIESTTINDKEGAFKFLFVDTFNTKGNDIAAKIILLISKYIIKSFMLPDLIKKLGEDKMNSNNESITIDYKEGSFKQLYEKTINENFNTAVPFFGHRKVMELIEIESIMCEKGQIWIDFIYKIS